MFGTGVESDSGVIIDVALAVGVNSDVGEMENSIGASGVSDAGTGLEYAAVGVFPKRRSAKISRFWYASTPRDVVTAIAEVVSTAIATFMAVDIGASAA